MVKAETLYILPAKASRSPATDYSKIGVDKAKRLAAERNVSVNYMIEDIFERDWPSQQYDNVVACIHPICSTNTDDQSADWPGRHLSNLTELYLFMATRPIR
jgi:hypothetical protein